MKFLLILIAKPLIVGSAFLLPARYVDGPIGGEAGAIIGGQPGAIGGEAGAIIGGAAGGKLEVEILPVEKFVPEKVPAPAPTPEKKKD